MRRGAPVLGGCHAAVGRSAKPLGSGSVVHAARQAAAVAEHHRGGVHRLGMPLQVKWPCVHATEFRGALVSHVMSSLGHE